jgi:hypothetical protein
MTNLVWTIINLSEVPDATIQGWISAAGISSCLRFVFQSPFANMWTLNTNYGGSVPMPLAPWTIAVSSNTDPRFNWTVMGLSTVGMHQATIGHWAGDSPAEAGARMWHEVLHCYGLPADNMQTSERAEFTEYLRTTGSSHYAGFAQDSYAYEQSTNHTQILIAFYIYLMHKYMDCDCFLEGCGEQPYVPSDGGSQPSETSSSTNWLLIGGAVVGLLYLIL